jgi:fructose/tagatose bisphosphate aldolase
VDYRSILQQAIDLGYHSVMVDGSRLPLEENIIATAEIVALARRAGIPCEAELGSVMGHETGQTVSYEALFASGLGFTDAGQAGEFVRQTGCDWLSVAIGNIHGAVSGALKHAKKVEARLNLVHLERLREAAGIPLVLHGGSGVRREDVKAAIRSGIAKINVGMEIRQVYETAVGDTGQVAFAQEKVFARTCELIRDYYGTAGINARVTRGA